MTTKQLGGLQSPDGSQYVTLTDGAGNIVTPAVGPSHTVSTLPSSPAIGTIATVTDGTSGLTWGATVTGGQSTKYLVWYNGTNWTIIGD